MGISAALLATAMRLGPSVSVEVVSADSPDGATTQALRGWLVQRLIEEGYTIAPTDQADRVLTLESDEDAVTLTRGADAFTIDGGPPAVMRLEALHRARMLLEHAEPVPPSAATHAVLGLRSTDEAPEGAAGDLESALLQAGYVLTPHPRPGDPVLCVEHAASGLGASVTDADGSCPDPQVRVSYAQLRGANGADAIVALLEHGPASPAPAPQVGRSGTTGQAGEPDAASPPDSPDSPDSEVRWMSRESEFRLGADAGVVVRGDPDFYARTHMRLGKQRGPGAQLHVSMIPSRAGSVRAIDTVLAVGPDIRIGRRRVGAEFGLVAGALVHAYADGGVRGGSANWYVGLPASLSLGRERDGVRAHLFTEGFITGGRLQHIRQDAPDWARSAWGVRLGLGITWGWSIR